MKLNKLLEKQLRKLLPEAYRENDALQPFIKAISESYNSYERDIELSERAFRITEEEYREINNKLKNENELREASINKLREAVIQIGDKDLTWDNTENELLNIASYIERQITFRKETEEKLEQQRSFYERILNQIPADIAIVDKNHRYLFVNPTAIRNPEIRKWIIGKTDIEYRQFRKKPIDDAEERKKHFDEVVKARTKKEWEEKIVDLNGQAEYHLRILHPVFDDKGDFELMVIYGFNITERKRIEEQIKISEAKYRSIFENSQALICTHDLNGKILDVNEASLKTFEYRYNELVGSPLSCLLPDNKRQDFRRAYLKEITLKGRAEGIMVALSKTGKRIYLLYQNFLVNNEAEDPYVIGFSQDITTRIEAERALKKSEEKYRSIIENMNLGLIEVDSSERILYSNQSFCEMSGYDQDELIGKNAARLFVKKENAEEIEEVKDRRKEGQSDAYELKVKNKRGELKWWLISGAPIMDNNGAFRGSIGIHLDITKQKQLEQELRKAKADAEHSATAKDAFLTNMSHEIRTPMNAILGIGRLLSKTTLDEQQRTYLNTVQNAANNLLVIINDLLDFSKIEAGKVALEYIGLDISGLITNTVHMLKHRAEEKGLVIKYNYDSEIAPVLIGDPYRINQILMNLMSNAIKFTEKGTVEMKALLVGNSDSSQKIKFSVTDTGIGISDEFIKNLFDKFSQEDESITRKFGGTGLGMSISKQLVELMGGQINVESRKNIGTAISFILTLPKGTQQDVISKRGEETDTSALKGKRILLVEDNDMNRLLATTILSQYGAEVVEAEDGNVAISKFEPGLFDLILMDVQMPGKDGIETTSYFRQRLDNDIPIIALTANAFKQEEQRCLQAGMNDFIAKPFEEEKMIQLLAKWLAKKILPDRNAPQKEEYSKLYDLNKIKVISRGDDGFVRRMLTLFNTSMPDTMTQMKSAFINEDWMTISALAHRSKPSIQNLGINTLTDYISRLESCKENPDPVQIKEDIDYINETLQTIIGLFEIELKKTQVKE